MIPEITLVLDRETDLPIRVAPNLAAFPHLVCLKRLGICTADGQVTLARVLEWFDRTHDVGAVAASLAIPAEAVAEAIRYADLLAKTSEAPAGGIASDEPVFGGGATVTGPRDLDDYPHLVRVKRLFREPIVCTAEGRVPAFSIADAFDRTGDVTATAAKWHLPTEAVVEALRYAQSHFSEDYCRG